MGEHEEPTAAFVDACRAVQDRGATLSFATGRPPAGVDVVRARTGSRGADVVHNGALVLQDGVDRWLGHPAAAAARIARWALERGVYGSSRSGPTSWSATSARWPVRPGTTSQAVRTARWPTST